MRHWLRLSHKPLIVGAVIGVVIGAVIGGVIGLC